MTQIEARQGRRPGGDQNRETQITGNPLSALKPVKAGETVPRDKGESDPGDQGDRQEVQGQRRKADGPSGIEEEDDRRPPSARLAIDIRRPRIPAEFRPRVLLAQQAQEDDGEVDRTDEIGKKEKPGQAHLHPLPHPGGGLEPPAGDVPHLKPPDDLDRPMVLDQTARH